MLEVKKLWNSRSRAPILNAKCSRLEGEDFVLISCFKIVHWTLSYGRYQANQDNYYSNLIEPFHANRSEVGKSCYIFTPATHEDMVRRNKVNRFWFFWGRLLFPYESFLNCISDKIHSRLVELAEPRSVSQSFRWLTNWTILLITAVTFIKLQIFFL